MRTENRNFDELRKIEIIPDFNPYAEGSCLIKCGQTHVICTATVEEKVPAWLKAEEKGWITAEYSLLPRATKTRVNRETHGVGGRTHEIQRLIGRSLRAGQKISQTVFKAAGEPFVVRGLSESVCFKNPPYGEKNGQEPVCCRAEQGKPQYNVGR